MKNPESMMNWYQTFTPDVQQRKGWYSSVAKTYDRVRPKYTQAFLNRAIEVAQIPLNGHILEVGCGPGTATVSLAERGFSMICLEPSVEAWAVACQNASIYPQVEIVNTSFEEWEPMERSFDAVLAPTSWHWIEPEQKHTKAASVLKSGGSLVLLWNTAMQPPLEIFEQLSGIFERYMPTLAKYKERETELSETRIFAEAAIASLLFSRLVEEYQPMQVNYAIDDYLQLLTTYSPCIALSSSVRDDLLTQLRQVLERDCGEGIPLSYLSIFHIAKKIGH